MKRLLIFLLCTASLYGQGVPVRYLSGSGAPSGGVASVEGTHYVDNSVSPPVTYICTSVSVAAGPSPPAGTQTCNWTQIGPGGSSSPSSVSSLPALPCTPNGTLVYLNTASGSNGVGVYRCDAGVWNFEPTSSGIIDPKSFGVLADTFAVYDATTTNGLNPVTIGAADPCFSSLAASAPAMHIEVTSWNGADTVYNTTTVALAETTVSLFNSCHSVNVTSTPTANCAGTCTLVVGHVDDTAWDAAVTAATTVTAQCLPIQVPAGMTWVDRQHFNNADVAGTCTNGFIVTPSNTRRAYAVRGWGPLSSTFFLGTTFNVAGCGGNSCFFGQRGQQVTELGLWGAGYSPVAPSNSKVMIQCGIDARCLDIQIAGFYWDDSSLTGLDIGVSGGSGLISDAVGLTPCRISNSFISQAGVPNFCAFGKGSGVIFNGGGKSVTYGLGAYSSLNAAVSAPAISVLAGTVWDSFGDFATCQTTGPNQVGVSFAAAGASTASFHGFTVVSCNQATTQAGITVNNTNTVYNYGSIITGTAVTGAVILNGTNAKWVDYAPQASTYTGGFNVIGAGRYIGGTGIADQSTAQTNNVGATTLYSVPATVAGIKEGAFRVSVSVNINTAGTTGAITANVIFVDGSNGATTTTIALCTTAAIAGALPDNCQGSAIVHAAPNTVIQWSTTGIVTPGSLSYIPWYRVEVL